MALPNNCNPCCSEEVVTLVPGTNGFNAYTVTTLSFVVPALGDSVTITVVNSGWIAVGQTVFIAGAGFFTIQSLPDATHATLVYQNISQNTASGNTIAVGTLVTPSAVAINGTNGQNAYTVTTADFTVPAISASETVDVTNSNWATVGQNVFVAGAGSFAVTAKPSATSMTIQYLAYSGNTNSGNNITAGAQVSPGATQPPLTGLGQNITETSDDDGLLAYDITNSFASVGVSVACPADGLYKIEACVTVLYTGVTFAASRDLSMRTRNTTQTVTHSSKVVETGIQTAAVFPAIDYVLPIKTANLVSGDAIELQVQLDTVESAGSSVVTDAWLSITPLNLT